jgi:tRNA(Arg) A34 adenosine deaminase TadA
MPNDPAKPYVLDPNLPIAKSWDLPLSNVASLPVLALGDEEKERHRIYSLALFALMRRYFNGNKNGPSGQYPWRAKQRQPDGRYAGGDYLGHNIGALAVDGNGEIIDFDFNHNQIFASSVEHAETRLVRRVFGLTQIYDNWQTRTSDRAQGYSTILSDVTLYTSLESCAQCSGVMALGEVKRVVFLQRDPGTYHIGNIMYSLTSSGPDKSIAPRPIPGSYVDFSYFDELNTAYADYYGKVADTPFWIPDAQGARPDTSRALTGFLCTDQALDIYQRASDEFRALVTSGATCPDWRPKDASGNDLPNALSNADALTQAARFVDYAGGAGRRGTPHHV